MSVTNLYSPFNSNSGNWSSWTSTGQYIQAQPVYSKSSAWGGLYNSMTDLLGTYVFSIYVKVSDTSTKVSTYKAPGGTTQSGYQVTNVWGDEGVTSSIPTDGSRADFTFANPNTWYRIGMTITLTASTRSQFRAEAWNSSTMYVAAPMLEAGDRLHAFVPYGGWSFHAAEGEYPINDNMIDTPFTENWVQPFATWLWRIDDNNDGYPYTDLMLDVLYHEPEPPPPEPTNPECANWLSHWFIRKEDMDLNRESVMGYISQKTNRGFQPVNFKYLPHWNNSIQDLNNKYYEMIGEDENGGPIRLGGEE